MNQKRYLLQLTGITFLIALVSTILFLTVLQAYYLPVFPFLLAAVALITLIEHRILTQTLTRKPKRFNQAFMAASAGKLFALLLVMVVYLIVDKEQVISFVIAVFLLYVIYTWYEVKVLLKLVQGKQEN